MAPHHLPKCISHLGDNLMPLEHTCNTHFAFGRHANALATGFLSKTNSHLAQEVAYCSASHHFQVSKTERDEYVAGTSNSGIAVGALLERIVAHARFAKEHRYNASSYSELRSIMEVLHADHVSIKSRPSIPLSIWLRDLQEASKGQKSPSATQARKLGHKEEVLRVTNLQQPTNLDKFTGKLSVREIVFVLSGLEDKAAAFTFYKWVKLQPNYKPAKSIFAAVVECLSSCMDSTRTWDELQIVMDDMCRAKMCLDNDQFRLLLVSGRERGAKEPYSTLKISFYESWFKNMRKVGFIPLLSTWEQLMKMCNRAGMHESTISVFKDIPNNSYNWSYRLALSACRGMKNLEMAEKLWKEMRLLGIKPSASCFGILIDLHRDHGDADSAEKLFEEMIGEGVTPDLHACTSMIHVYAGVHKVKQAELLFNKTGNLAGVSLDPAIYRAMAGCYSQAGLLKELLALFNKAKENNLKLGAACYCSAIQACADMGHWEFAAKLFKEMQGLKLSPSPKLYCTMLDSYMMAKQYYSCENLFSDMIEMKIVLPEAFELIIHMYKSTERYACAVDTFRLMKEKQCQPTSSIYEEIIDLGLKTNLLDARELYHNMLCAGQTPSLDVYSSLIWENISVGDLLQGKKFYEEMQTAGLQPSRYIMLSMISGYKEAGEDKKAAEIVEDWQKLMWGVQVLVEPIEERAQFVHMS